MKGTLVTIAVDGTITTEHTSNPHLLPWLKQTLGGYIEAIPYWTTFRTEDKKLVSCMAFCNEEGKLMELPFNGRATLWWYEAVQREFGSEARMNDVLVGPVVVVYGDREFMNLV